MARNIKGIIKQRPEIFQSYRNFSKKISFEEMSLYLKHRYVITDQLKNNYENILILEDDVIIPKNFKNLLEDKIYKEYQENFKNNIYLTILSNNANKDDKYVIPNKILYYNPLNKTRGTGAMIFNIKGSKIIDKYIDGINLPIDFKLNEIIQAEDLKISWLEPGLKLNTFPSTVMKNKHNNNKNIILSSNYNPNYIEFLPLVATAWKKFGYNVILALVTDKDESEWEWMKDYAEIHRFNIRDDIDEGILTKIARMLVLFRLPSDQKYMTSDIDMLPLQQKYFDKLFEINAPFVVDNDPLSHPKYANKIRPTHPTFPICYQIAAGTDWREIINPEDLDIDELIESWKGVGEYDEFEDINNDYNDFSDESLMRRLIYKWSPDKSKIRFLQRGYEIFTNAYTLHRLDRGDWYIYEDKLLRNEYIDSHLIRPLNDYKREIKPLVDYLKINRNVLYIANEFINNEEDILRFRDS